MKNLIFSVLCCAFIFQTVQARKQLEIHTITLTTGEATAIVIRDMATGVYTGLALIDAGNRIDSQGEDNKYRPSAYSYLYGIECLNFEYVILTHYHDDHFMGLTTLEGGDIQANKLIDLGGYNITKYAEGDLTTDDEIKSIQGYQYSTKSGPLFKEPQNLTRLGKYFYSVSQATALYGLQREQSIMKFPESLETVIQIGTFNGYPVNLKCVTGNGYVAKAPVNTGKSTKVRYANRPDDNNYCLSFVLSVGEFRYFIGGDLPGLNSSPYVDQETPLATYFIQGGVPRAWKFNNIATDTLVRGHICGYLSNHHGSDGSSNPFFLRTLRPSYFATTAWNNGASSLPTQNYCERIISNLAPMGDQLAFGFTNLKRNGPGNDPRDYILTNVYQHYPLVFSSRPNGNGDDPDYEKFIDGFFIALRETTNLQRRSSFSFYAVSLKGREFLPGYDVYTLHLGDINCHKGANYR